jgi:hypothetical protein
MIAFTERVEQERWQDGSSVYGGLMRLSFWSGVSYENLLHIQRCERPTVDFGTADRIIQALDLTHLYHLPPEAGGFADIYEVEGAD